MNKDTQIKIEAIVKAYAIAYKEEFKLFKEGVKKRVHMQRDKFATLEKTDFITRALYEIPETLLAMIRMKLEDHEWKYYESKEGGRWFAKKFKDFAVAEKV